MDVSSFFQYIENPSLLNNNSEAALMELCKKYPFTSTLQLLYTKNLQNTEHIALNEQLKIAAAYSTDRKTLHSLLLNKKQQNILPISDSTIALERQTQVEDKTNYSPAQNTETTVAEKENKENEKKQSISQGKELDFLEEQYLQEALINSTYAIEEINSETENQDNQTNSEIDVNTQLSFSDWLNTIESGKLTETKKYSNVDLVINQLESIEFTDSNHKTKFFKPSEMAKKSVTENDELITETLAHIYFLQGNYQKALNAYKKLSLKYPEKKSYFATQIKLIKEKNK
ncbi:MAG: hypothetical protein HUU48_09475 [Flavobacteriales bacterium]|nr:hypothetical protein [Flavobacteriales bacterium]